MDESSWLDEARKLTEYRKEAVSFLLRASSRFDASPEHAKAVSHLWLEADKLDSLIYGLLEEINRGLLSGKGEIDVTRGASVKPHHGSDTLFYDCTWSILWKPNHGIAVNLAVEPASASFEMKVASLKAGEEEIVPFPPESSALKNTLKNAYAAEASIPTPDIPKKHRKAVNNKRQ